MSILDPSKVPAHTPLRWKDGKPSLHTNRVHEERLRWQLQTLTPRLERARAFAATGTDTLMGLNRIGETMRLYRAGLITEEEAIRRL